MTAPKKTSTPLSIPCPSCKAVVNSSCRMMTKSVNMKPELKDVPHDSRIVAWWTQFYGPNREAIEEIFSDEPPAA